MLLERSYVGLGAQRLAAFPEPKIRGDLTGNRLAILVRRHTGDTHGETVH